MHFFVVGDYRENLEKEYYWKWNLYSKAGNSHFNLALLQMSKTDGKAAKNRLKVPQFDCQIRMNRITKQYSTYLVQTLDDGIIVFGVAFDHVVHWI